MKKTFVLAVAVMLFGLVINLNAGVLGDVDNDGKVSLNEAVNALQVAAGKRSETPVSYVIVWKGPWATGQVYNIYDAVQYEGTSFICLKKHASVNSEELQNGSIWNTLARKGDKGDPGAPVNTVAICASGSKAAKGGDCDCGDGTLVSKVISDCQVTADTGSCSAQTLEYYVEGGYKEVRFGSCCVCIPAP